MAKIKIQRYPAGIDVAIGESVLERWVPVYSNFLPCGVGLCWPHLFQEPDYFVSHRDAELASIGLQEYLLSFD